MEKMKNQDKIEELERSNKMECSGRLRRNKDFFIFQFQKDQMPAKK